MSPHIRNGLIFTGSCVALGFLLAVIVNRSGPSATSETASPGAMNLTDGPASNALAWQPPATANSDEENSVSAPLPELDQIANRTSLDGGPDRALGLANDFFDAAGSNNSSRIRSLYRQTVMYFGKIKNVDAIMDDKIKYIDRWPVRSYSIELDTVNVTCDVNDDCKASGIVDWTASNPETDRNAAGTAEFRLSFSRGLVTSENSRVTSRQ